MKTVLTFLIIALTMQTTLKEQDSRIVEIVIYKVNQDHQGNLKQAIDQARSAVYGMPGFVSYQTFKSMDKEQMYMDYVTWESLEQAKAAAAKVTQLKEFASFGQAIEDIVVMDHLEFYH